MPSLAPAGEVPFSLRARYDWRWWRGSGYGRGLANHAHWTPGRIWPLRTTITSHPVDIVDAPAAPAAGCAGAGCRPAVPDVTADCRW